MVVSTTAILTAPGADPTGAQPTSLVLGPIIQTTDSAGHSTFEISGTSIFTVAAPSTSLSSKSTVQTTVTRTPSPTSTAPATATSSSSGGSSSSSPGISGTKLVAIIVPIAVVVLLIPILYMLWVRHRSRRNNRPQRISSNSTRGRQAEQARPPPPPPEKHTMLHPPQVSNTKGGTNGVYGGFLPVPFEESDRIKSGQLDVNVLEKNWDSTPLVSPVAAPLLQPRSIDRHRDTDNIDRARTNSMDQARKANNMYAMDHRQNMNNTNVKGNNVSHNPLNPNYNPTGREQQREPSYAWLSDHQSDFRRDSEAHYVPSPTLPSPTVRTPTLPVNPIARSPPVASAQQSFVRPPSTNWPLPSSGRLPDPEPLYDAHLNTNKPLPSPAASAAAMASTTHHSNNKFRDSDTLPPHNFGSRPDSQSDYDPSLRMPSMIGSSSHRDSETIPLPSPLLPRPASSEYDSSTRVTSYAPTAFAQAIAPLQVREQAPTPIPTGGRRSPVDVPSQNQSGTHLKSQKGSSGSGTGVRAPDPFRSHRASAAVSEMSDAGGDGVSGRSRRGSDAISVISNMTANDRSNRNTNNDAVSMISALSPHDYEEHMRHYPG